MDKKVTPMSLAAKSACTPVCTEYDWAKQSVKYDVCKAGSAYSTGTNTFGGIGIEDYQAD